MSDRKLNAWVEAGLIDRATADRIHAYEEGHARPWGLWALIGLGALTIGLGLVSLVAANWDAIPGGVRLALHLIIMAGFAGWLAWRGVAEEGSAGSWFSDAMLFILAALGLTFLGHIGQVYQTSAPLWQPIGFALLIFTPLLLLFGRGILAALLWFAGLIATSTNHGIWLDVWGTHNVLWLGFIASLPALTVALAAAARGRWGQAGFWRSLQQVALVFVVGQATMFTLVVADLHNENETGLLFHAVIALAAAGVTAFVRPDRSGRSSAMVMALCGVAVLLSALMDRYEALLHAAVFLGLWGGIAWVALQAGWRRVFQTAIGISALRIIILSFELATDLLGSGIGLILVGLFTLGVAWVAVRVSRNLAPKVEGEGLA